MTEKRRARPFLPPTPLSARVFLVPLRSTPYHSHSSLAPLSLVPRTAALGDWSEERNVMRRQAAVERNEERQRSTMETEMMLRLISSSFPFPSPHPPPFVPSGGRRYAGRTKGGCGKVKGRDGKELEEMRLDQKAAFWRILSTCLSRLSSVPFPFVPSVVVRSGSLCSPSLSTPVSLTRVAHSVSRLSSFVSLPHSLHS